MDTLTEVIKYLRKKNKIYDFDFIDDFIICKETGERFSPEDLKINRIYRFEGDSSADDMSILYYLESKSGTRGIITDAFGTYGNPEMENFLSFVKKG